MEALSLLKYWKTNTSTTEPVKSANVSGNNNTTTVTTAIVSAVEQNEAELEDDGPFFDLKLPVDEQNAGELDNNDVETPESDEKELDLEAALAVTGSNEDASEQQRISSKAQFHESVLKSATKLRVFVLGSNKTKSKSKSSESSSPKSASNCSTPRQQQPQQQQAVQAEPETKLTKSEHESKFFAVKFRAEDVPLVSLFTRDTSKSASNNNNNNNNSSKSKSLKQNMEESDFSSLDEKKSSSKEVVHEYLKKKVKPLYIRVSRPSAGVKLGLNYYSRAKSATVKAKVETKAEADTEADARAKVSIVKSLASAPARKHSAKSRTALAAVAAAPSVVVVSSRRDDSLLQQQDGIQSAILHCKRSFNDSKLM